MVMTASRANADERVQLVGTIKGAGCTRFRVQCGNDDKHIALEEDSVLVMPKAKIFFCYREITPSSQLGLASLVRFSRIHNEQYHQHDGRYHPS